MRVEQLMCRDVVTVTPETTLKEVAALLAKHRISGMPVCDAEGRVVGVVSEADILWKELGGSPGGGGLLARVLDRAYGVTERVAAVTAGDAMTSPPVTVAPGATVATAARLMIDHAVNRLPVLEDGRLVGIVARSDLVRAFKRSDEEIEREISEDVLLHTLWIDPDSISLAVTGGVVTVAGEVDNRSTAELIEHFVRLVPGVASVRSLLRFRLDDLSRRTAASADSLTRRV
ncbi:MAG TPA: CBS domain-containing protein [Gaiellaceae bacterium]|nr:CBS domain-containing protein [Gaiellaceae bacterium]